MTFQLQDGRVRRRTCRRGLCVASADPAAAAPRSTRSIPEHQTAAVMRAAREEEVSNAGV